jgi:hypothetical protein
VIKRLSTLRQDDIIRIKGPLGMNHSYYICRVYLSLRLNQVK